MSSPRNETHPGSHVNAPLVGLSRLDFGNLAPGLLEQTRLRAQFGFLLRFAPKQQQENTPWNLRIRLIVM